MWIKGDLKKVLFQFTFSVGTWPFEQVYEDIFCSVCVRLFCLQSYPCPSPVHTEQTSSIRFKAAHSQTCGFETFTACGDFLSLKFV